MKKFALILAIIIITGISCCLKAYCVTLNETEDSYSAIFPAGTMFKTLLQHKISSETNNVNDAVELIIPAEYNFRGINFIPKDTIIIGKIIKIEKAKLGQNGLFEIMLYKIILPENEEYSILSHIWTKFQDGIIGGEVTQRAKFKKVPHGIQNIGSVVQLIPDGPREMGKEKELLPGTEITIVLDRNLEITTIKE